MERVVIYHQRRKHPILKPRWGYEIDHIIPYCISKDDSIENLQYLPIKEHNKKTGMDRRIINILVKKGFVERVTNFVMEMMVPLEVIKKEYLKELRRLKCQKKSP